MRFPSLAAAAILLVPPVPAEESCDHGHDHDHDHGHPAATTGSPHHPHLDLHDAEEDGWFHFHPHLSAAIAVGGSTSEKNLGLIAGGHAPLDDGFNLQGIELGAVVELGTRLSLHGNYNVFWDRFDGWDGELEEAYAAYEFADGLSARGGQFLAPFGHANTTHLHDRDFVEPPISVVRLLGEDGLFVQGGEFAWRIPAIDRPTTIRFGYGQNRSHSHGGDRERRNDLYRETLEHLGEEDHDDEDHDDEEHEEEHGHGFAGGGGVYDAEEAYLDDGYFFARVETRICEGHGLRRAGLSFAGGENGFGRTTWIAGLDLYGTFEIVERPCWWRSEVFYRSVDAYDRAGLPGHFDESGVYASLGCEFLEDWTTAARLEWASGNRLAGAERRWRASANVGRVCHLGDVGDLHTRLQYSYDDLGGYGNEHSIWLQWVLNLGAAEHCHEH